MQTLTISSQMIEVKIRTIYIPLEQEDKHILEFHSRED